MGGATVICRPVVAATRALRAPWRNPATVGGTRRRSPRCRLAGGRLRLAWIAVGVVGVGAGAAGTGAARRPPGAMGNGDVVTLTGSRGTAGIVMAAAHLRVAPGVVPAAVTHRPISGRTAPSAISPGRSPATLSALVTSGAHGSVRPGHMTTGLPRTPAVGVHQRRRGTATTSTEAIDADRDQVAHGTGVAAYVNPLRDVTGLTPERIDQGVDYSGEGPLLAVGPGTVEMTTNAGWPGGTFIALRLDSGPYAGRVVYYAEDITPVVAPGQHVRRGQVVGRMFQGPDGIELGWGDPRRVGQSIVADCYQEGGLTGAGLAFSRFLSSLGAPGGRTEGRTPTCPMPGTARRAAPPRSDRAGTTTD